jgi:N utilization substance protein B
MRLQLFSDVISTKSLKNAFSILFQAEIHKNAKNAIEDEEGSDAEFNVDELIRLNVANSRLLIDDDAQQLITGVLNGESDLDTTIQNALHNWELPNLATSDRVILRIGAWLILRTDDDSDKVIKSMRKLAEAFSDKKSAGFVTGVLSNLMK